MNIIQLPFEIASQLSLSTQGLKEIGHNAKSASYPTKFYYRRDYNLELTKFGFINKILNTFRFFKWAHSYDIFHYHQSYLLPFGLDIAYLKLINKPFFIQFHGSDIRINSIEHKRNPYYQEPEINNSKKQIKRLKYWSKQTNEVIIADNSFDIFLEPYFNTIHITRQLVDTSLLKPVYPDVDRIVPKIVHAPTNRDTKGTIYIEKALESLRLKNIEFEYIQVENMTHDEAIKIYSQADIIADELLIGSHGIFACEGMALGKPVVTYIQETLLSTYPDGVPIVNANPDTIESVLEELILSPQKRHDIGKQGREYVERVHDIKVVAKRLEKIYLSKLENGK